MEEEEKTFVIPEVSQLKEELRHENYKKKYRDTLKSTLGTLIVVAAIAILAATMWMPVFEIYGTSMTPTLSDGQIVVSIKGSDFEIGDVIALYYGNKLLVKRVIAGPGQWVDIKSDGTVYVDNVEIDEPYVSEKAYGDCNLTFPYQVPDGRYFFLGDHRSTSSDSRNSMIGCASEEQIIGKIIYRIWPLGKFGKIDS